MADLPARLVLSLTPIGPQVGSADTGVGNVNDGVRWLKNGRIRNLLDLYIKSSSKNGCFHMPTRSTDRGDRAQDHVGDDLRTGDHDHMGAFHLGDRGPRPPGHGTDDIGTGRLVAGSNHGPGR